MGSNALKATILDRGHAKEASRGVESHFAAQGTARQRIRQRIRQLIRQPVGQRNRNPHRCAIEGGVKDPMGRHDV